MENYKSLLEEALEAWQWVREGLVDEVKNVPADKVSFRLNPETRSILEVGQHVVEVALMMTGELCRPDTDFQRESYPKLLKRYAPNVTDANNKQQLIALLRNSQKEGEKRFREVGDLFMLQLIRRFDGKMGTRLAWLHHGIGHEMYHTGQLTAYVRALGLVPALTQRIGG